jgi:triosephosphate isomerase
LAKNAHVAAKGRLRLRVGVTPDNVRTLAQPEVDGVPAGGASLDANSFASIVNF